MPVDAALQQQVLAAGRVPVDAGVLRRRSRSCGGRVRVAQRRRRPRPTRAPRVGLRQRREHADGRRLAGAVRAEQPEDLALAHGERHAVERLHVPVALAEVLDDDRVHGPEPTERQSPSAAPWISTSTRGRSCSRASASRSPTGGSRRRPTEARAAAEELGGPVVVKAQVLTGGRGKAGGVKLADEPGRGGGEARGDPRARHPRPRRAPALDRAGLRDREGVLPLGHVRPRREAAAASCSRPRAASRSSRSPPRTPTRSSALHVDPLEGFQPWQRAAADLRRRRRRPGEQKQIAAIVEKLYRCFVESDAMLCEINPLIVTPDGEVRALDAKVTIDDTALFRHPDIAEMRDTEAADPLEALAREKGVTYVKLDGSVGILGNGAGPRRCRRVDVVASPAAGPRTSATSAAAATREGVVDALEVITRDPQVRSILFNIFGGITRCDEVARGILAGARADRRSTLPIVVRLDGTNAEEGRAHPRRGRRRRTSTSSRRCSTRPGARWSSRHDAIVWSERAERVPRRARRTAQGADLDLIVEWASRAAADGARRRDRRRARRAAAARGRARGRHAATRRPGMQPDVICLAEDLPFADASFDLVACARRGAPLRRRRARRSRELARVARERVIVVRHALRRRGRSRRPSKLRDPSHVRNYTEAEWRELLRAAPASRSRRCELFDDADRARAVARARRAAPATTPSACASCSPTAIDGRLAARSTAIVAQGAKPADGDHRRPRHAPRRPGPDRQRGPLPRPAQPRATARTSSPASRPGKGGQDVEGIPVFDTVADAVARDRREHVA